MARVKTFINGGNVLPSDLDAIEDDYEVAFGTYKHLFEVQGGFAGIANAGTWTLTLAGIGSAGGSLATDVGAHFWLDPAKYWTVASTSGVNPRAVQYNVSVAALTNATSAGTVTFTTGLWAVTGSSGGVATYAGSAVSGSTVAISNPGTNAVIPAAYSGDFTAPAAGFYSIRTVQSANTAASSGVLLIARVSMRQI